MPARRVFKKFMMMNTPNAPVRISNAEINSGSMLLFVMARSVGKESGGAAYHEGPVGRFVQFGVAMHALYGLNRIGVGAVPAQNSPVAGSRLRQRRFRKVEVAMAAARQTWLRRMAAVWAKHFFNDE